MLFYSRTSQSFIHRLTIYVRDILASEMGITVRRTRFEHRNYLWPIHIACFEDPKILGYFDVESLLVGVNRTLMVGAGEDFLKNLLRHELAHYICYIQHGRDVPDHGKEYRHICQEYGWGKSVFGAKVDKKDIALSLVPNRDEERILSKIKKLMALGSSCNQHESDAATVKANELLVKYNLERASLGSLPDEDEEVFYGGVAAKAKRKNATLHALATILQNFLVRPVFSRKEKHCALEVVGTRLNVELAIYVAHFLQHEFERLWKKAKKENPRLKGTVAKNSFIGGMAKGLEQKLKRAAPPRPSAAPNYGMAQIECSLERAVAMAYPNLNTAVTHGKHCPQGAALGEQAGKTISIRPGLKQEKKGETVLLN